MSQIIEVPGMGQVEFPDGMSDADISAAIQRSMPAKSAPAKGNVLDRMDSAMGFAPAQGATELDKWKNAAANVGSAIARPAAQAIMGIPNMVADFGQATAYYAKKGYNALRPKGLSDLVVDKGPQVPKFQSQRFNEALDQYTRPPQTTGGKVAEALTSAAMGTLIPMPSFKAKVPDNFVPPPANPRDAAFIAGRNQGMVAPPASVDPTATNRALETLGGKVATQQDASIANMPKFNEAAKKTLGMAADETLNIEALDNIRREAGKAYDAIAKLGKLPATESALPGGSGVKTAMDSTSLLQKTEVDAKDLVSAWKQANHDATGYFRAYTRDANPETLLKAKQASGAASQIDDFLQSSLQSMGKKDLLNDLKSARVRIAKTYSVESALNQSTGNVSGTKLAQQLARGKPLSGPLGDAARFAQAFPKASREILDSGAIRNTDLIAGGGTAAITGSPWYLGYPLARSAARSALLSPLWQQRMLQQSQGISPGIFGATAAANQSLF